MAGDRQETRTELTQSTGRVLIVVPTYNEAENIAGVLNGIKSVVPAAHVLVVDDGSPDGTAAVVSNTARLLGDVHLLERAAKSGLGAAYRDGFAWGLERGYDVLVEMDADGSHDTAHLTALLAAIDTGADLAVGSRYVPGGEIPRWSPGRRALSRWGNRYAAAALKLPVADATSGFRAYRAATLRKLDPATLCADGYGFQVEGVWRVARHGGNITEVPICFQDRVHGSSKMSKAIVIEAMKLVTKWGAMERWTNAVDAVAHPVLHHRRVSLRH
ncbi:MAG TPA: polyprenol monophosphomannose synthase [Acidimicrobiales bacterium]|nr:polyprenol monophosphomannose synthase [Acidimicrobiales bacterium]